MKYILGVLWLVAALAASRFSGARRAFGYAGSIVFLVHASALTLGLIQKQLFPARSVDGGVSLVGFLAGILLGGLLGVWLGGTVWRNQVLYWPVQFAAAVFLMFLPLFRL